MAATPSVPVRYLLSLESACEFRTTIYSKSMDGINTTHPYEVTSPGVARHQCTECGGWERSDKNGGRIRHSKRCESQPQVVAQVEPASADSLKRLGRDVRTTATTKGRDEEVFQAVRRKHLSVGDAMNTDD